MVRGDEGEAAIAGAGLAAGGEEGEGEECAAGDHRKAVVLMPEISMGRRQRGFLHWTLSSMRTM